MDRPAPRHEVQKLNDLSAEKTQNIVELMCQKTIDDVYEGIAIYLNFDREAQQELEAKGYPKGEAVDYYVVIDDLTAPRKDKEFVSVYSTRIESEDGRSYIKIFLPIGDANSNEFEMPKKESVNEVFIEMHDTETHWFAIHKTGLYEYVPLAKQDEEAPDILSDQGIWQWIDERVPETLQKLAKLDQNMVNWDTVHQNSYIIGS